MNKDSFNFLSKLLETPSPSGFEAKIQSVVKKRVSGIADLIEIDVHGNLIAAINPDAKLRVMLAGHCDQIGMMVTHIDDKGFIYFNQIGGIDPATLPGSKVVVHTADGPLPGVIGQKPIHLQSADERGKKIELKRLWIDIGATSAEEAGKLVAIGDAATCELGVVRLGKHAIAATACDDRVGVYIVMEALRILASRGKKKLGIGVFAVSTVQEEIGLRGAKTSAFGIDPQVGIAVDVTHASDNPGADAKEIGTVKLGKGPTIARGPNINPVLERLLRETAKKKRIPHQTLSAPGATGTDANVIQLSRSGVATALLGIPNRYMHTPAEMIDLRDLESTAKLIAETVSRITPRMSFIPS